MRKGLRKEGRREGCVGGKEAKEGRKADGNREAKWRKNGEEEKKIEKHAVRRRYGGREEGRE